jgi:hypothetical protein
MNTDANAAVALNISKTHFIAFVIGDYFTFTATLIKEKWNKHEDYGVL